jgi:hypothetical protein
LCVFYHTGTLIATGLVFGGKVIDDTQFLITNKNDFDWTNIKMEVNEGIATWR